MAPRSVLIPRKRVLLAALLSTFLLAQTSNEAHALITGGTGNAPMDDPGWPQGAVDVFNVKGRVAWWEGPPFGGGQYHAECRGNTQDFNKVLKEFAKIEADQRILVVHDGAGRSFWLDPNKHQGREEADTSTDWTFVIWRTESLKWHQENRIAGRGHINDDSAHPRIDVYTGGNITWDDVVVPEGVEVRDERLVAHGFKESDGFVIEGNVTDLESGRPIEATATLTLIKPKEKGGYDYTELKTVASDGQGRWVMTDVPAGWHQVVVRSEGYVPRIVGYTKHEEGAVKWNDQSTKLARSQSISGRVMDPAGKPISGATVRLYDVTLPTTGRYESQGGYEVTSSDDGTFLIDNVPASTARVSAFLTGHTMKGLGPTVEIPVKDVEVTLYSAGEIEVVVDFTGKTRPDGYIINMEPEGGSKVGSWGGSGNIDASGAIHWKNIPPGKYVVHGRPNPGSKKEQTEDVVVTIEAGKTTEVVLKAK